MKTEDRPAMLDVLSYTALALMAIAAMVGNWASRVELTTFQVWQNTGLMLLLGMAVFHWMRVAIATYLDRRDWDKENADGTDA